jgi:hypothetical protein
MDERPFTEPRVDKQVARNTVLSAGTKAAGRRTTSKKNRRNPGRDTGREYYNTLTITHNNISPTTKAQTRKIPTTRNPRKNPSKK